MEFEEKNGLATLTTNSQVNSKDIKKFITAITCAAFLGLGVARSVAGPELLDLLAQTKLETHDLDTVYLFCALTFPLGNLLGGMAINFWPRFIYIQMTVAVLFMAVFFSIIPFSSGQTPLIVFAATSEFFMGVMDTGCNTVILKLWNSIQLPTYLTCLHLSFAIGQLVGPILASLILSSKKYEDLETLYIDKDAYLWRSMGLSDIQFLHILISIFTSTTALMLLVSNKLSSNQQNSNIEEKMTQNDCREEIYFNRHLDKAKLKPFKYCLIGFVVFMVFVANGVNFAYSNFINYFAEKSELQLSKAEGHCLSFIYFGCSVTMRLLTIFILAGKLCKPITLLYTSMGFTAIAAGVLAIGGEKIVHLFYLGTGLAGAGIGIIFPMAIGWIESKCSIGTTVMTIMVVSTSLGAQVFKIPITKLIHKEPISLINFFNYFVGALLLFFIGAITTVYLSTLVRSAKDKYETEEKEIGTKQDSETTNISSDSSKSDSVEVLKKPTENCELLIDSISHCPTPIQSLTIMTEEFHKTYPNER